MDELSFLPHRYALPVLLAKPRLRVQMVKTGASERDRTEMSLTILLAKTSGLLVLLLIQAFLHFTSSHGKDHERTCFGAILEDMW